MTQEQVQTCKARMWRGWRDTGCLRKAWADGYCKQHHPDSVKARQEAAEKRYEEKQKRSPWIQLGEAQKRIAELEAEVTGLRQRVEELRKEREA